MYIFLVFVWDSLVLLVVLSFVLGFAIQIGNFLSALFGANLGAKWPISFVASRQCSAAPIKASNNFSSLVGGALTLGTQTLGELWGGLGQLQDL